MKMQEHLNNPEAGALTALLAKLMSAGAILLAKFGPAAAGAALMVMVDMPKTKRDAFCRFFAAFLCSYLFGDVVFDFLDSTSWFSFLDRTKHGHLTAVLGFVGAIGYFAASGLAVWLRKFSTKPVDAIRDARGVIEP